MAMHLPKDVERSIQAAVRSGRFASVDDAMVAAWRAFQRSTLQTEQVAAQSITPDELNRRLLADGLISRLPDPEQDVDDDDVPLTIAGEPLSETIIRERR